MVCTICSGQERFGQRICTSPSGRTTGVPHAGQCSGIRNGTSAPVAVLDQRRHDLRDHVAGALDHDAVADPKVLAGDVVLVVQGRPGDGDAATATGSITAYGTRAPVRPTLTRISRR